MYNNELSGKLDKEELEKARLNGKKIGLVQGSWDLFHLGHLKYIKKAKELCDYLIIAMDSDEKIRKRKGNGRPIVPENERQEFIKLLEIADDVVIKGVEEKKWGLIKEVKPDVLIAIRDNYTDEQITKLEDYCGRVAILPRQSESSTSDKIRKITIAEQRNKIEDLDEKVAESIEKLKKRIAYTSDMKEPIPQMIKHLKESTDWKTPVVAACYYNSEWHYGTNLSDFGIPKYDVENRTELFYSTVEHAEVNLLKKLGNVEKLDVPVYVTLLPCDKCMKLLIDKGVKKIFFLEDHPERNWSKRSRELATRKGVELIKMINTIEKNTEDKQELNYTKMKYIYPPNARNQEQLDIMINREFNNEDPLDPNVIDQEILFTTDYWYVSKNRFPHQGSGTQFLIVALNPVYNIYDMNDEMWNDLMFVWQKISKDYNIPGGAFCFRYGDPALSGASLKRLHAHLIMPEEEKVRFPIGGHKTLKRELRINKPNE